MVDYAPSVIVELGPTITEKVVSYFYLSYNLVYLKLNGFILV